MFLLLLVKLQKEDGVSRPVDTVTCQSIVWSLLYAAITTRQDIAQAVGVVSQFCANPTQSHLTAAKRILRYLKGTVYLGLSYKKCADGNLIGYSDADWAGDVDDRHSTSGNVFLLAKGAVSWLSKKQATVALSTAEAKYVALSAATQEAIWLRRLLTDVGESLEDPIVINEDNQGAIAMAENPVGHARAKHIYIRFHFVREGVQNGAIILKYVATGEMIADILTKPLPKHPFEKLVMELGIRIIKYLSTVKRHFRLHSLCILQGGAEDFFFSGSFFYIPPPRSIQIFRTPQAISRKINTPPPPSPLPRNIKINICIIVNYICLKSQETCLIRTSREL